MPITLNHSNISVQYSSVKSYIIETVKSDLYRKNENVDTIIRNNIQVAPVTPSIYIENGTNNVYAVESYTYSGTANTADYTRVFTKSTTCDILVVGGGGGGGTDCGGGGGGGGVIYATNVSISANTYTIKVGKGGAGMANGISSEAFGATANGGGSGGGGQRVSTTLSNNGGSGGGGGLHNSLSTRNGGAAGTNTIGSTLSLGNVNNYNGNVGGTCPGRLNSAGIGLAAGGGGAGSVGIEGINSSTTGLSNTFNNGKGKGGDGVPINITGQTYYWAAGGGGGTVDPILPGAGGRGGGGGGAQGFDSIDNPIEIYGGAGGLDGIQSAIAPTNTNVAEGGFGGYGAPNTGSGGGGGGYYYNKTGGSGGSGIVIIRYLLGTIPANNLLTTEPVLVAPTFTETIRTFAHSGGTEDQTTHTITIGQNTICDILIVGGGGGGGDPHGGGGGAGQLVLIHQAILSGTYTIKVGKGGIGGIYNSRQPGKGVNSEFGNASINVIAEGGGANTNTASDKNGGSGAGGDAYTSGGGTAGAGTKNNIVDTFPGAIVYSKGNDGGVERLSDLRPGGGGGSGMAGDTGANGGKGGDGLSGITEINYDFKTNFGTNVGKLETDNLIYFAGGGGGGYSTTGVSNGSKGGGGSGGPGATGPNNIGSNATQNTGSGGGGGGGDFSGNGGNGGSGIVIIKFKSIVGAGIPEGNPITHKILNFLYNNDNLVAWYRFNGDYLDNSGYGNHLTNVGTVIQSTQVIEGQAVEFDSTDYLEFPATINPYTIWNGKGITFSCWIRYTATLENWTTLINFQTDVSNNTGIGCWIRTTPVSPVVAIYLRINSTIFQYGDANTPLIANLNVWRHFVLCVGISGKIDVYIDNVRINGTETATIPNLTYNARYINRSGQAGTWDGQMDDFRIYDRALSAADVSLLYNKTYQQPNNTYTVNFPVPTLADINNNTNIVLRGEYDIALSTTNSAIIPKTGQYIPKPTTFTNYAVERMYPPVRNFTAATTVVSGQTYGNGTYVVSYSSTFGETYDPFKCFNTGDIIGGAWAGGNRYADGVFNSTSFIVAGYLGDWLKIQLPVAIRLTRFSILQRIILPACSPKDFKIYGSNDNITWVELINKKDAVYNASYIYEQTTPEISNTYTYYGLVVNKIISAAYNLNFDEWYIYGQEASTSSLTLRYNLLNPILDPIGAQWTYSSNNTNVYHMGSVGIGTTSPEYQLDVRGAIYSSVGGYTQTGLTTWSITSDRRIKENITRASYDICLENVKNIELYNFNFKNNCVNTNDKHQLGFIAQEVQQVYPKAVEVGKMILNTNEAISDILTLNTTQIDYTLYGAVKNLIEKIEDIDNDLENIEKAVVEPLGETAPHAGN